MITRTSFARGTRDLLARVNVLPGCVKRDASNSGIGLDVGQMTRNCLVIVAEFGSDAREWNPATLYGHC